MKLKLSFIIFLLGVSFNIINALDYAITFKGQGATNVIDTIKVINISQNTSLTFSGNSILHLVSNPTEVTGVTGYHLNEIRFYPNPMNDYCIMEFDLPEAGNTLIQLFDMSGRLLTESKTILNEGIQTFRISGILNGVYFTRVSAGDNTFLGKLVSTGGNINQPHISYEKTIPANAVTFILKSAPNEIEMNYNDGDTLQFTFVSGKLTTTVTDIPAESKTLIANFTETVDLQNGLVAYYPFNGNANDESGNGHHGTVNGATLTSDRFGTSDHAYAFNGQSNSISVCDFHLPTLSTTITFWVKVMNGDEIGDFISKHTDAGNVEILMRVYENHYRIEWTIENTYFTLSDDIGYYTINPNEPRFDMLTLVYNGQQACFYVNQQIVASLNISGNIVNNAYPMTFGEYAGSNQDYYNGILDDIRIYNRALNNAEIQALYSEGNYPPPLPLLATEAISNITKTSAVSGGEIISDGGSPIVNKGICWSTSPNPDTTDFITNDGSDTGTYISNLAGLIPNTTYYIKAYAINNEGIAYGNELCFTTLDDGSVDLNKGLVAYYPFNGNANDESGNGHHGVVNGATLTSDRFGNTNNAYSFNGQNNYITVNGFNLPTTSTTINLWVNVTGTEGIGEFISKHTHQGDVEILIRNYGNQFRIEWTIGGSYFVLSDYEVKFPIDINNPQFVMITLTYNSQEAKLYINNQLIGSNFITGEIVNNTLPMTFGKYATSDYDYYKGDLDDIRIYNRALNNSELQALYHEGGYPLPIPILSTSNITNITQSSAKSGGNILTDNGSSITAKGVCWSTSPNPDTADFKTLDGDGNDSFTSNLSGLLPNTTYYVRAYAVNSAGVGYGNKISFTTLSNVNLKEGLVAYYPFNFNANDESGNEHHAVVEGATLTTDRFGNTNRAYSFDSSSTIKIVNNPNMNLKNTDCFSMVWWFRKNGTQNELPEMDSNVVFGTCINKLKGLNGILKNATMHDYKWHMAVAIVKWDSNMLRLCIDGLSDTISIKVQCIGLIKTSNISLKTIAGYFLKKYFIGKMDDIRIYNRELNNDEILTLYHEGDFPGTLPVLVTRTIYPSQTRARSGGEIKSYGGTEIGAKGVCWSDQPNPDISDYKTFDGTDKYDFYSELINLTPNTTYYVKAYVINCAGVGYGDELSFTSLPEILYDSITDIEGNVYKTVEIGNQIWMAENLRTTKYNDGSPIPNITDNGEWTCLSYGAYCWYNNDEITYKNDYGALYNYYVITDNRKICPTNWHIPTPDEWETLEYIQYHVQCDEYNSHCYLNEAGSEHWANTSNSNESGFTALAGGVRQAEIEFKYPIFVGFKGIKCYTIFWKSTGDEFFISYFDLLSYYEWRFAHSPLNGYSIRCIKD